MAILKASADTNAGQNHRLTHRLKNLHRYNLKSLIFKHSLKIPSKILHNFWRPFFCKPITHKCHISSFNLFHLVQTRVYSCKRLQLRKKIILETWHFRLNFPHHTQAKVKSPPPGKALQIKLPHSPGTENGQMPNRSEKPPRMRRRALNSWKLKMADEVLNDHEIRDQFSTYNMDFRRESWCLEFWLLPSISRLFFFSRQSEVFCSELCFSCFADKDINASCLISCL